MPEDTGSNPSRGNMPTFALFLSLFYPNPQNIYALSKTLLYSAIIAEAKIN